MVILTPSHDTLFPYLVRCPILYAAPFVRVALVVSELRLHYLRAVYSRPIDDLEINPVLWSVRK
jgi:hypothetical protein